MKISSIRPNPKNPRLIKDDRFFKLVKSVEEFPKMMKLRPIVVDGNGMILGGNMRYKALVHLGFKEIPDEWVKQAEELTEKEKERFIIEDNISFGDWDWVELSEWDSDELNDWGLELPNWSLGVDENNMTDEDVNISEEFDPIGTSAGQQRVVFIFDGPEEAESYLNSLKVEFKKMNMAWQVNLSTQSILSVKDDTK